MSGYEQNESDFNQSDPEAQEEEVRPKRSTRNSAIKQKKVEQENDSEDNNTQDYDDDGDEDYSESTKKRKNRDSRKKTKKKSKAAATESDDDQDIDDEQQKSVPPLKIKLPVRELRPKRNTKRKPSIDNEEDIDNEDEFETSSKANTSRSKDVEPPSRRSERIFLSSSKKQTMAEKESDDEQNDNDDNGHRDKCQSCRQGGDLILCDYCPRAYHNVCLDEELKEIPDDWCCPYCEKNGKPDPKDVQKNRKKAIETKKASNKKPTKSSTTGNFENQDYCEICNQCGELLLCDTCPRAYHKVCMDPDIKIPSEEWSCPHCEEFGIETTDKVEAEVEKPEKIICKVCRSGGDDIIFCATCPARYHPNCLNPPLDERPGDDWQCAPCSVEPLDGKVQRIITWRWKKQEKHDENEEEPKRKSYRKKEREFFVKWKDRSYWHCSWIDELQLQVFHTNMHRNFCTKNDMNTPPPLDDGSSDSLPKEGTEEGGEPTAATGMRRRRSRNANNNDLNIEEKYLRYGIRADWLQVHRVVNHRKQRGKMYYSIKWRELPYEEVTVEADPDNCEFDIPDYRKAVENYWDLKNLVEEEAKNEKKNKEKDEKRKGKDKDKRKSNKKSVDPKKKWDKQPDYIPEPLELHPYQMEGVNWLRYSWASGTETILADEMGLGKTIQTIVFLYSLYKEGHTRGPFLITAPLSTIINWERELEDWAPDFYVVNYTGNKDSRIIIRENELSFDGDAVRSGAKASRIRKHVTVKFHVLLTSYELINVDSALLGSIDWKVLVVDEAHRLKSNQSLFFRTLNTYNVAYKLLLTGTPLQNNLEELFNLLNFLSPQRFNDMEGFLNEFADIAKEEQVKKLHDMLGPHLLRRMKADVLAGMPSKSEFIVRVDLAPLQKKYYKFILTRNFDALNIRGGGRQCSLLNIVMDLKKCCNHPYLFPTAAQEAPKTKFGYYEGSALVKSCGKLILLQKMLKKLKSEGHRVLIFSQMTLMLDLLEDFLEYEQYKYERIDGGITGSIRQDAIDRFNAPGAQQFVFLLSTRAGGLGINLATADTVIIYDSDWNPHNDIQALSRAHRIGQSNKVMIYRFVTRGSVEERITQVAKKKMMLTHLVVRPGLGNSKSQASMSKQELDDILKFGTEELFKEEEGKEDTAIHYDDKAIEELLDRSKEGIEQKEMWANEYLGSFKVASYATKEAEEIEDEEPKAEEPDPQYWEKLLGHHYIQHQENIQRTLGKGKRVRKQVNYNAGVPDDYANNESESSSDYSIPSDLSENDEDFDLRMEEGMRGVKLRNKHGKEKMPPLVALIGGNTEVLGFTAKHRKAFLDVVMRFGLPSQDLNITDSQWYVRDLKGKSEKHLRAYASLFVQHLCNPGDPNSKTFDDGVPKEGLNVSQVLARIGMVSLIRKKVHEYESKHGLTSIKKQKKPEEKKSEEKQVIDLGKNTSKEFAMFEDSQSQSSGIENKEENKNSDEDKEPNDEEAKNSENGDKKSEQTSDESKTPEDKDEKMDVEKSDEVKVKQEGSSDKQVSDKTETDSTAESKTQKSDEKESQQKETTDQDESEVKTEDAKASGQDQSKEVEDKDKNIEKEDNSDKIIIDLKKDKNVEKDDNKDVEKSDKEVEVEQKLEPFDFNIRDGGLTELHTLWYFEEQELKPGKELEIWHRRHDYWLLASLVKHGYERWKEIHEDEDFAILTEPFKNSIHIKNKFMERRLRLLEQALVFEEQLRRTAHLERISSESEDKAKDGEVEDELKEDETNDENKPINPSVHRCINQYEELLTDMKSDCGRIPQTVQRIPPIAQRLQISQKGFNAMGQQKRQLSL